jgi:multiple sugar transport system substrate-binding protein
LLQPFVALSQANSQANNTTTLKFSLLVSNGEQRTAYLEQIRAFEKEFPHIKVQMRAFGAEEYKTSIEDWLQAERHSDVMYWFGGERLNWYVRSGWVSPLDGLWSSNDWGEQFTDAAQSAVVFHGQRFAVPMHYYHWGIYYKKSLFERLGITPPKTWNEFLQAGKVLQENDITPIALGSKEHWPLAGWFDYLNLRINGLDFHQDLLRGLVSYEDERVKNLFQHWQVLKNNQFFLTNNEDLTWRDALPYLYRERAGMMLMGNFWVTQIPKQLENDIGAIPFPMISETVAQFEEAPTDVLLIPSNVQNRKAAETFLAYMARPQVQAHINNAMGMLSPSKGDQQQLDYFLRVGKEILDTAEGISQFYDRDTPQPLASEGMIEMQRFLNDTASLSIVLKQLNQITEETFDAFPIVNQVERREFNQAPTD